MNQHSTIKHKPGELYKVKEKRMFWAFTSIELNGDAGEKIKPGQIITILTDTFYKNHISWIEILVNCEKKYILAKDFIGIRLEKLG